MLSLALAPLASADHTDAVPIPWRGYTNEDDGASVQYSSSHLDGTVNRVHRNVTESVGDGSLFLDSYVIDGRGGFSVDWFQSAVGQNLLLPNYVEHHAWYGWWNDLNQNGAIDDDHDGTPSAVDEFKWRGGATNEQTALIGWTVPSNIPWGDLTQTYTRVDEFCTYDAFFDYVLGPEDENETYGDRELARDGFDCNSKMLGVYHDGSQPAPDADFMDETPFTEAHQNYRAGNGWENVYLDEGLLMTVYFVTAANPTYAQGSVSGWDLEGPDTLVDVDRYDAVDATVEVLYHAGAQAARQAYLDSVETGIAATEDASSVLDALDPLVAIIDEAYETYANDTYEAVVAPVVSDAGDAFNDGLDNAFNPGGNPQYREAYKTFFSPLAKEPDNAEDVYPHAFFDGVRDLRGEGNDYSAHLTEFLFFGDVIGQVRVGAITNVNALGQTEAGVSGDVGDIASSVTGIFGTNLGWSYLDPYGATNAENGRSVAPVLGFEGYAVAWKDLNGDTWVGEMCTAGEPDQGWDSCDDAYNGEAMAYPQDFAPDFNGGETLGLCGQTSMADGDIHLVPMGGNWPDVVVLRWYDKPTRNLAPLILGTDTGGYDTEVVSDNSVIDIRWDPQYFNCNGDGYYSRAADEVIFPRGTGGISFKTVAEITLLNDYKNVEAGVIVPKGATFIDVDYYVAGL